VRLVSVSCPQCGAVVNLDGVGATVRCEYCGTISRVQQRTRILERVIPARPEPGAPPLPVVTAPHSRSWKVGLGMSALVMVGVIGASVAMTQVVGGKYFWHSHGGVVLGDVNGDGVADVIGRAYFATGDGSGRLVAHDGATGQELWRSEVYSKDSPLAGSLVAAGGLVFLVKTDAQVIAYDLTSGKRRFGVGLPEKASGFCAADGGLRIQTADGGEAHIDEQGAVTRVESDEECWEVNRDGSRSTGPGHRLIKRGTFPELDGMTVDWGFRRRDGAAVLLGYRAKGTPVPMLAAHAGAVDFWIQEIPASDPLRAATGAVRVASTAGDRVVVAYAPDAKAEGGWGWGSRLTAFSLADGRRLWDVKIPTHRGNALGVQGTPDRVYVSSAGRLHIFSATDGRHIATRP
jgi:DNA-directed RNA polymerase subunit RPC12/RpoP